MRNIFGILISLLLFLSPTLVFGRAGGGEDFGGGGFDTGSSFDSDYSYSSGSSSGTSSPTESVIGTIILIIIIIMVIRRSRKGLPISSPNQSSTGSTTANNSSMNKEEIGEQLKKLKDIDSGFDAQRFKTHAKKVFMAVQEGWTKRDQNVCRPFMAEEVYQSHQMQIDNMKSQKIINVLKNIVVGGVDFAKIELDGDFHKIYTKIRAQMRDFKVKEDEPNKPISGEVNATEPFTEYWVFIRKSNLKTKVKDGIFDRKCPNCGAPIDVNVAGKCKYCNATVVNGDYDWVLSEIIQSSEWNE